MYYNKENISRIEHAINFLDEVEYYDWSDDTITETELAREIQDCINELYDILEKAKKHERELYCKHSCPKCNIAMENEDFYYDEEKEDYINIWICPQCGYREDIPE